MNTPRKRINIMTFRNATLLVCALALPAPAAMTHIHDDHVVRMDGTVANGSIFVACQKLSTDGKTVVKSTVTIAIRNGVVDATLFAQDTAVPANTTCHATYQFSDRSADEEDWAIPASLNPVTLTDLRVIKLPAPSYLFQVRNLNVTGMLNGVYCFTVASGVGSLTPCTVGGVMGAPFDTYTGLFDSALGLFDAH